MTGTGPCVGCFITTTTAVAFRGPDEWLLAALMTIMDTEEVQEAQDTLDEFWHERETQRARSGSMARDKLRPANEQLGTLGGWKTIHVGCCAECAARGRFLVSDSGQVPCYVPPNEYN